MVSPAYTVITPARDEEQHLPSLIHSMLHQTIKPTTWVIVDDGSTDGTAKIADRAAEAHLWIKVAHQHDRGFRQAGGGVMDAFYRGLDLAGKVPWDFLVKLDADLCFAPDYFQQCFARFDGDDRLGIAGGTVCLEVSGRLEADSKIDPEFHVRGATKIYRNQCWRDIGGLIRAPGWDTIDEIKANMLGWRTRTFADVKLVHQRPTGKAYGTWSDMVKGGRANYIAGYHPLFMTMKCFRRLINPPYLTGGVALFWGYVSARLKRIPRVEDPALIEYFRQQQINRILGRKSLWSDG